MNGKDLDFIRFFTVCRNKPDFQEYKCKFRLEIVTIDSFHIVSAHAPNSLVPRYLREITLKGATFIRLPMHYTMEYEKR